MAQIVHSNEQIIGINQGVSVQDPSAVVIDSHTNASLLSAINADPSAYSIVDGTLLKDGAPVVINDWCDDCKTLDSLDTASTVAQLRKVLMLMRDKPGFTKG